MSPPPQRHAARLRGVTRALASVRGPEHTERFPPRAHSPGRSLVLLLVAHGDRDMGGRVLKFYCGRPRGHPRTCLDPYAVSSVRRAVSWPLAPNRFAPRRVRGIKSP